MYTAAWLIVIQYQLPSLAHLGSIADSNDHDDTCHVYWESILSSSLPLILYLIPSLFLLVVAPGVWQYVLQHCPVIYIYIWQVDLTKLWLREMVTKHEFQFYTWVQHVDEEPNKFIWLFGWKICLKFIISRQSVWTSCALLWGILFM